MITIRKLQPEDDRMAVSKIYEESWKYAYRGIINQEYLDSISGGKWIESLEQNGRRSLVVEKNGEFIGTSSYGKSRFS